MTKGISKMMVHIECRSQEVLCRVPYNVALKFCEVDEEFKEKFKIANRRHLDESDATSRSDK